MDCNHFCHRLFLSLWCELWMTYSCSVDRGGGWGGGGPREKCAHQFILSI